MNRLFLYSGLLFILILIFDAYDRDYNTPQSINAETQEQIDPKLMSQPPADGSIDQIESQKITENKIRAEIIESNKLLIKFDVFTGKILFSELKDYPRDLGSNDNIIILDHENKKYTAASSLQILDVSTQPTFTKKSRDGQNKVTLEALNIPGIKITKTIEVLNNSHQIIVTNQIENRTPDVIKVRNYETISRDNNSTASVMLPTYTGSAFYDEENKFSKLSFDDIFETTQVIKTKDSWISMIEHYFFSAWLPTSSKQKTIYTNYDNNVYTIGSSTNYQKVNVDQIQIFESLMFVGPKLQSEISNLTSGLDLTVDYGILTFLSAPLFWILDSINYIFDNWGLSIIILTILIKALFFKLSETSYRSMAQMKKLNPRMQALKDRYGEDKKKFSEALMRMYKEEKVNPLGGCLPILIQIPVFIALYWVLVESIEIRHAPFFGWIQDLSSADPYFILPIAMGASMYIQQKLNPAPTDPTQQKIFMFLPFIFTALFATFPSGLVLYWFTNNVLSIAQQYVINKRIVG